VQTLKKKKKLINDEGSKIKIEEIVHYFLFTLYTWTAGWLDPLVVSFPDFLSRLSSPS
jgi:hypothetical protein